MSLIGRPEGARLGVWIDQELDTGSGIQVEICPEVFIMGDDGLTYTHIGRIVFGNGFAGIVPVPEDVEDRAIEAVEEDPGEVTFVEFIRTSDDGFVAEVWDSQKQEWEAFEAPRVPLIGLIPTDI